MLFNKPVSIVILMLFRVAFVDVEVKDSEKVFGLNEDDWEGCELAVKLDETLQNKKQKHTKGSNIFCFQN